MEIPTEPAPRTASHTVAIGAAGAVLAYAALMSFVLDRDVRGDGPVLRGAIDAGSASPPPQARRPGLPGRDKPV